MKFGEFLKQQRDDKGWTQPEASIAIGIEQSYLSKLENNKAIPSQEIFEKLIQAYQFDMNLLGSKVSDSELEKLKDITAIRDLIVNTRRKTESVRRVWLVAGLFALMLGACLTAYGVLMHDNANVTYIYESKGVIKEGESAFLYSEIPQFERFLNSLERGDDWSEHPLFERLDFQQVTTPYFNGNYYDVKADGGKRRFFLISSRETRAREPFLIAVSMGLMLLVGGMGAFFVSRRW